MDNLQEGKCICSKKPSKGWIRSFLLWWPEIKLGNPSGLDPKCAQAFNQPVVGRYFKQLDDLVKKYDIPMEHLYNMDEKGVNEKGAGKPHHESILFLVHVVQSINSAVPISNSSLSLSVFVQMGQILSLGLSFKERNSAWSGLTLTMTSCMS